MAREFAKLPFRKLATGLNSGRTPLDICAKVRQFRVHRNDIRDLFEFAYGRSIPVAVELLDGQWHVVTMFGDGPTHRQFWTFWMFELGQRGIFRPYIERHRVPVIRRLYIRARNFLT